MEPDEGDGATTAVVEFCGERWTVRRDTPFVIGREGDLALDDNLHLHRFFFRILHQHGVWWLENVGSHLGATVSDTDGRMQAWLATGARLPLVFGRTVVWFTAGPTSYDFEIILPEPDFVAAPAMLPTLAPDAANRTIGDVTFTPDQLLLIIALAEPALRRRGRGMATLPSSAAAAERLGWQLTRFNRKLDNVCSKLARLGFKGLYGGATQLATDRRTRLVEIALAARWVTAEHLSLLERARAL